MTPDHGPKRSPTHPPSPVGATVRSLLLWAVALALLFLLTPPPRAQAGNLEAASQGSSLHSERRGEPTLPPRAYARGLDARTQDPPLPSEPPSLGASAPTPSPQEFPWLLGVLVLGGVGAWWAGKLVARARLAARHGALAAQDWDAWNRAIDEALILNNSASADMLTTIPPRERVMALRRYLDTHKERDLLFDEQTSTIEPAAFVELQRLAGRWSTLVARLDVVSRAAPTAARIIEQLCNRLGFAPLESRTYKSLYGHVIKAPAVRLSIPPRFPIIFLLKRDLAAEDLKDVRDLMSLLGMNAFFALLVVVDDALLRRERAREFRRLVRGGADDLIVLDYHDVRELFLAADSERRLIEIILGQVDLTMVSPYVSSGPVSENMFFGRDYELKAIVRTIRDRSFAIVGGRKIGKTSVLSKVHRLMEAAGPAVVGRGDRTRTGTPTYHPFYLDCQHVMDYAEFFGDLAIKTGVEVRSTSPGELRRMILRYRQQHPDGLIVLLLDEVDKLLTYDLHRQTRLFRVFRALSQEGLCRLVFCGERQLNAGLHDPGSPLFNFCSIMRLSYLTPRDAARMIQEPMAAMGMVFEDPDAVIEGIIGISSCHPSIVQAICQMLVVRANERGDRIIRLDDLARLRTSEEFRELFLEVTWGNATPLERLISVLMVPSPRFTAAEVRAALRTHACEVSPAAVDDALEGLCLFSILQKERDRYIFAARSFPAIIRESRLADGLVEGLREVVASGA
jgi:hypothetical protein